MATYNWFLTILNCYDFRMVTHPCNNHPILYRMYRIPIRLRLILYGDDQLRENGRQRLCHTRLCKHVCCRYCITISWYRWGSYGYTNGDYNASMCSAFLIVLVWFGRKRIIYFIRFCKPHNGAQLQQNNISI